MKTAHEQFEKEVVKFFKNLAEISSQVVEQLNINQGKGELSEFVSYSFDFIKNEGLDDLKSGVRSSITEIPRDQGTIDLMDHFDMFYKELLYFNARYQPGTVVVPTVVGGQPGDSKMIGAGEFSESADVVLGSFEKLIKRLPKKLQRVIKVLREAMGLIRPLV